MKPCRIATLSIFSIPVIALALVAQSAQATILVTNTGANPVCSPSEVTLGGGSANYCAGYFPSEGNPTAEATKLNDVTDGADWNFVYKVESTTPGSGLFDGIKFTLTASTFTSDTGTWSIAWEDTNGAAPSNLPLYIDLGVAFKAGAGNTNSGGGIAYFLFDDFLLTASPSSSSGTFDLLVNKNLSHESLFVRLGSGGRTPPLSVPEPGVVLLLGAGLVGLGLARRRKPV